jgi:LacI family transcriptional regulator
MRKKGPELTGVKEIARRAKVSIGTVDRVLHNRKGVSEETKKKINAIIKELAYKPNQMASLLAKKKILSFAVLIPKASKETDYWNYPLDGIKLAHSEIAQFGISLSLHLYDLNAKDSFTKEANKIVKQKPDGLILAPSFVEESLQLAPRIKALNIPMVFINSDLPNQEPLSYIGPDLFHSGRLAAQLVSFFLGREDEIMVINISTELENDHHVKRKESGFRKYFKDNALTNAISTVDISQTKAASIETSLIKAVKSREQLKAIFVTNSRVSQVAQILKKHQFDILLLGYDFLDDNIRHLKEDHIKFLICQRPKEQGYLAVMALYKHLFHIGTVEAASYTPIDIITKENYSFYKT